VQGLAVWVSLTVHSTVDIFKKDTVAGGEGWLHFCLGSDKQVGRLVNVTGTVKDSGGRMGAGNKI
jgi:hypothetical protein